MTATFNARLKNQDCKRYNHSVRNNRPMVERLKIIWFIYITNKFYQYETTNQLTQKEAHMSAI